jgi:hypothetical protein
MFIGVAVTLAACASIAWGLVEMRAAGRETLGSGLKIGLALLPALLGLAIIYNFWRATVVFAAIRRGENVIGRWTVTAVELAEFAACERALTALGGENVNVWAPPRVPPSASLEVIFAADGVLVGDTYFSLVPTGVFRIGGVRLLSDGLPAIAFRTVMILGNRFGFRTSLDALRIPVSRDAMSEANRVVGHFGRVQAREVIVNAGFYEGRMRFGLIAAPIFLAIAAVGVVLKLNGIGGGGEDVPAFMIGIGTVLGGAMLILALAAWRLGRAQRRQPR